MAKSAQKHHNKAIFVQDLCRIENPGELKWSINITSSGVNSEGNIFLYLHVNIAGKRKKIPIDIQIPENAWDSEKLRVKKTFRGSHDLNLLIDDCKARANKILIEYRLAKRKPTIQMFTTDYLNEESRADFIEYMASMISERSEQLAPATITTHRSTWKKLRDFSPHLAFHEITPGMLENFERWLQTNRGNDTNTRNKTLRNLRTYVNIAIRNGYIQKNAFTHYHLKRKSTDITFLSREEVVKLRELYRSPSTPQHLKNALQPFLFCCFAGGIRISDVRLLNHSMIKSGTLSFIPKKTKGTSTRMLHIPLNQSCREFLNLEDKEKPLFNYLAADQVINRHLKSISLLAQIQKPITFHVSRHSFATLFLELGGKVEVLREIMGHSKIETTMRYVHISKRNKGFQMDQMDQI